jgi:hypothetical protein
MQVRMKQQVLSPRVQNRRDAELGAQAFRIGRQREQRLRRGPEQQLVQGALVTQDQRS